MTIGVIYRVAGQGAIVASDGRVTHDGHLVTDSARKWVVCGPPELAKVVAIVCGEIGPAWRLLQQTPPKSFASFLRTIDESNDQTDYLAFDRIKGRLWLGDVQVTGAFAALGSGDAVALGALEAMPIAKTLAEAEAACRKAIQVTAKYRVDCGGRTRVVVVPGGRRPVVVR